MARTLLRLEHQARSVGSRIPLLVRARRSEARQLLKRVFDLKTRVESGLDSRREDLLALREMHGLENELALIMSDPRPLDQLRPEKMLRPTSPLQLAVERFVAAPPMRLRWPLQYDLYRFEVLGGLVFAFLDILEVQEARTGACLEKVGHARLTAEHSPRERDIEPHEGELAKPPKRRQGPGGPSTPNPEAGPS